MRKQWKIATGLLLSTVVIASAVGLHKGSFLKFITSNIIQKEANDPTYQFPNDYSADEDMIIAEIVPDYTYAQLSYGVAGREPIDLMKACQDGYAEEIKALSPDGTYKEYAAGSYLSQEEYDDLFYTYFQNDPAIAAKYVTGPSIVAGSDVYQFINESGEITDKTFLVTKDSALQDQLVDVLEATGDNVRVITITSEELNGAGTEELKTFLEGVDLMVFNQTYINGKEDLQKQLIENYGVKVHKTTKETGNVLEREPIGSGSVTPDAKFTSKDLNWSVVQAIFKRVGAKSNSLSVVMDRSVYTGALDESLGSTKTVTTHQYLLNRNAKYENNVLKTPDSNITGGYDGLFTEMTGNDFEKQAVASNNNTYKLFLMSMFRDPTEFYNLFVESGLINDNGKYTLLSNNDAKEYWNTYSFLPCKGDLPGEDPTKPEAADEVYWKNKMNICVELPSGNYVNGNALSMDFSERAFWKQLTVKKDYTSYVDKKEQKTLLEVLYDKQIGQDAEGIIAYEPLASVEGKTYQVLDIEPACSINEYSLNLVDIERVIPYTSYSTSSSFSLNIIRMSTAEFIGRTENLISTYDMIYIGRDISGMNTLNNWEGKVTTYGETADTGSTYNKNMEGVIYAHVGGAVQFRYDNNEDKFSLESESGKDKTNGVALYAKSGDEYGRPSTGMLMYSGNDITNKKKEEIENFCKAGLPVLVAEGLIEDAMLDDSTLFNDEAYNNMRKLLRNSDNGFLNLSYNYRTARKNGVSLATKKLSARKPVLTLKSISYNKYGGSVETISGEDLDDNPTYEFDPTSSDRKITFQYTIQDLDNPGADYECQFYIDKNADGVFKKDEAIGNKTTVAAGDTERTVSININTNYRGPFTWKMELTKKSNRFVQVMKLGYGTIRLTGSVSKKAVKVLQVEAIKGEKNKDHSTEWGYDKAQNVKLWDEPSGFPGLFRDLEDYTISVDHTTLDVFNGKDLAYMKTYDMIIFGFADSYRDMDMKEDCCKNVQDYIKEGYSVLFTHDLTSQINNQDVFTGEGAYGKGDKPDDFGTWYFMETTNGYAFNRCLRDAMGLNRFGLKLSEKTADAYDDTGVGDKMGFTYSCLMQYSNFKKTYKEGFLGPYRKLYVNFCSNEDNPWPNIHEAEADKAENYQAHYVNNVNDGQITKYPFDLSEETGNQETAKLADGTLETRYKIAPTHGQYYQLNMEDEDIICWYTLSDGVVNKDGTWKNKGWYTRSLKDVSNNYYIYSNGNVTYSGVGHSTSSEMTTFEKKLFVNTMVAALRAGIEGPAVHIQNAYNVPTSTGEERDVVYANIDADSSEQDFATKQNVDFYLTDDSVKDTDTNSMYVTVEIETDQKDENGNMIWEDVTENSTYQVYKVNGSAEPSPVSRVDHTIQVPKADGTGTENKTIKCYEVERSSSTTADIHQYRIKYPKSVLKNQNEHNFRITVYNTQNAKANRLGAVMRMTLFKLD